MTILEKKSANYSTTQLCAIGTSAVMIVWGWSYFLDRHFISGRYGHPIYPLLNIAGCICLILMIKRGIPGAHRSWMRSFRWAYFASFGIASLAIFATFSSPHCPDVAWGDCPPKNKGDLISFMATEMDYYGCIPEPYKSVYDAGKLPNSPDCDEQWYLDMKKQGKVVEDVYWPPPLIECAIPRPPCAITGLRTVMPLVGMGVFLIPLIGMSRSEQSTNSRRYLMYSLFIVILIILYLWSHFAHPFFKGNAWHEYKYLMDWTVPFIFLPAASVHLFSCSWIGVDC